MSETMRETKKVPEDVIAAGRAQTMATGSYVRLRAVQEEDLEALAGLLAGTLCPRELVPWTTQRLKKKFNAGKDPGFWSEKERVFLVVRIKNGEIVGFIDEREQWICRNLHFHIAESETDRSLLGEDMLATYLQLVLDWHNQVRIEAFVLACEEQKQQWLKAAGFELEASLSEMFMYQGNPEALQFWGWINPRFENGAGS